MAIEGAEKGTLPLVTIITVCYHSEKTIKKTMESVLRQTYPNIEYVVIDGNSQDRTVDMIREYQECFKGRMKFVSESDQGIYDAMNKGIRLAAGELIGILNSDDDYEENAVEEIVKAWDRQGMQILYGLMRTRKEGKEYSVSLLSHQFLQEHMIWHPACFVTKDVYQRIGLFDTRYRSVADYDFMLRARDSGNVRFVPVYAVIANYSGGGMSTSSKGYLEGLRYRRDRGLLSNATYTLARIYEPIRRWGQRKLWK
ncbi:MAG: glycosyltransferase [Clostridium sp.]|nr:glycosyltransferase [Clostridium sp.]